MSVQNKQKNCCDVDYYRSWHGQIQRIIQLCWIFRTAKKKKEKKQITAAIRDAQWTWAQHPFKTFLEPGQLISPIWEQTEWIKISSIMNRAFGGNWGRRHIDKARALIAYTSTIHYITYYVVRTCSTYSRIMNGSHDSILWCVKMRSHLLAGMRTVLSGRTDLWRNQQVSVIPIIINSCNYWLNVRFFFYLNPQGRCINSNA